MSRGGACMLIPVWRIASSMHACISHAFISGTTAMFLLPMLHDSPFAMQRPESVPRAPFLLQVLLHQVSTHRTLHDLLQHVRCPRLLADIAAILVRGLTAPWRLLSNKHGQQQCNFLPSPGARRFILFFVTMKRQIMHMIKYKYLPFSMGKKVRGYRRGVII